MLRQEASLHGLRSSITHMLRTTGMPSQFLTLFCAARSSATRIPSSLTRSRFTYTNPLGSLPCGWKELSCFSAVSSEDWACDSPTCTGGGATFPNAILGRNWSNRWRVSGETNYVQSAEPYIPRVWSVEYEPTRHSIKPVP